MPQRRLRGGRVGCGQAARWPARGAARGTFPLTRVVATGASNAALPGAWLVGGLGFSFIVLAWLMMTVRVTVGPVAVGALAIYAAGATAVAIRYGCRSGTTRWRNVARDYSEYVGLFAAICLLGAMASYPIAAANHGFVDGRLEAIDRNLGFDWIAWYDVVAAHPVLQHVGRSAYDSIFVTPTVVLGYFALEGRRAEARSFIASFWLAVVLTLLLFSAMPAEGPLAFLWHGRVPYMPISALYQAELIPALRDHALRSVDPGSLHGLVCAPSFHAASGILYIAAGWRCRPLRWPIILLNGAMLLATPVEGTHYLIDIIAGIVVAFLALAGGAVLAKLAARRVASEGPARRSPSRAAHYVPAVPTFQSHRPSLDPVVEPSNASTMTA